MIDWSYHRRAKDSIAHGYLTNSKNPLCLGYGAYPTHIKKAHACYVWDSGGKRYTDYICGLGTNLLGYGHTKVLDAISEGYRVGGSPSIATELEIEVAEDIKSLFPFIDTLRFLKTGSEACQAAVRIARAYTGKSKIVSEGYHGWSDEFTSLTPPATGVPRCPDIKSLNDGSIPDDVAGAIIEPIQIDWGRERIETLKGIKKEFTDTLGRKRVLIYDEIITGFRWRQYSVSRDFGTTPDIICLGKAIANGLPLAVVGGRKEVMDSPYFVSSTYAGDTVSLAACKAVIGQLKKSYDISLLWREGQHFLDEFNGLWDKIQIAGYPTRGVFKADTPHILDLFHQECVNAGILFGPSWFFNFPLIGETQRTLETCKDAIQKIKNGKASLKGQPRQSPFSQKSREKV